MITVKELKELIEDLQDDQIVLLAHDWANNNFSKLEGVACDMIFDEEANDNQTYGMLTIVHDLNDTGYDKDDEDWIEIMNRGIKVVVLY